jgi:hypothetical protein
MLPISSARLHLCNLQTMIQTVCEVTENRGTKIKNVPQIMTKNKHDTYRCRRSRDWQGSRALHNLNKVQE